MKKEREEKKNMVLRLAESILGMSRCSHPMEDSADDSLTKEEMLYNMIKMRDDQNARANDRRECLNALISAGF
jgi:hypothetical protein